MPSKLPSVLHVSSHLILTQNTRNIAPVLQTGQFKRKREFKQHSQGHPAKK